VVINCLRMRVGGDIRTLFTQFIRTLFTQVPKPLLLYLMVVGGNTDLTGLQHSDVTSGRKREGSAGG
jgi:hypothetical protein